MKQGIIVHFQMNAVPGADFFDGQVTPDTKGGVVPVKEHGVEHAPRRSRSCWRAAVSASRMNKMA